MISSDILNKANGGKVDGRETQELAAMGTGFPFGNLLAILEASIKDVDRAAKDASTVKVVTAGAGATE